MNDDDNTLKHGRFMTENDIAAMSSAFTMPSRLAKRVLDLQKPQAPLPEPDPSEPAPVRHQFRPTSKPKQNET